MDEDSPSYNDSNGGITPGPTDQDIKAWESTFLGFQTVFSWSALGLGIFGVIGNILILLVFTKMGFDNNTIHISYMALAVSDLGCVVASMAVGFTNVYAVLDHLTTEIGHHLIELIFGLPYLVFSRTTALLTAWISFERCLCVAFPTRVKLMITRKVTTVALVAIFIIGIAPVVFVYANIRFFWQLELEINSTTLMQMQDVHRDLTRIRQFILFLYGLLYPLFSWVSVMVCTTVLVVKLRQSTRWRRHNLALTTTERSPGCTLDVDPTPQRKQVHSTKETRITKVVVIVASVFLTCSAPSSASMLATIAVPEYFRTGSLRYLYRLNGMIGILLAQLNSSISILIFTASGQRFRSTLHKMVSSLISRR